MKLRNACVAVLVSMIAFTCGRESADVLRVTSALPEGVVARDAAIFLQFSRGVVSPDSVNLWTSTPYITFAPEIPGKFSWTDTARLVFSPDAPLPGDARFNGIVNSPLLLRMSGASSFEGPKEFTFSTERFMLRTVEFFYARLGESREIGIRANLEFSYAVDPQEAGRQVSITINGQPQPIARVVTTERSRVIAMEIGSVVQLQKGREISVMVNQDLISPETATHIWMEKPFVVELAPLAELEILGHEAGFDGISGWIRVRTSQEIDTASVRASLLLEPVRAYGIRTEPDGFTLRGDFEPGTTFRFTVRKGLQSILGGSTQNDYEANVVIGNVAPAFRFASSTGTYMLLGGEKRIEIKTVNLPKLAVRVSQVFQNNLVFLIEQGRYYDYSDYSAGDEEGGGHHRKFRYTVGNYGRQLSYDTIDVVGGTNQEVSTWLDLSPYMKTGYKGFYVVEIANPAEAWRATSKLISISDLGLIVKQSPDEVSVFVTSLLTNEPAVRARVSLISTTNQVMGVLESDRDGLAQFERFRTMAKDFELKLVTAELENDFNFLNLEDYRIETSRFDVAGKRSGENRYDAMLYGDRNIYRPGEKIFISGVLRDFSAPLPEKMPVRLRISNPHGTLLTEQQHLLNDEHSFESSYQTQQTSMTGEYRFDLLTGDQQFITTYRVSVEDFVPDRLRVTLTQPAESAWPGEVLTYNLLALNFFGPPAAGRNWEFEGSFDNIPYRSKRFPEFRFSDDGAVNYSANPDVFTGKTDEHGAAEVKFPLPTRLTSTGLLRATGKVAVFDESGRPVYQIHQTIVYPKRYFIGVRNLGAYYVAPNVPQKVQLIAVDAGDNPINDFRAVVSLIRSEWHSVLREHPSTKTLRYVSEKREILVKTDTVTLSASPLEYNYAVPRSGDYTLRVSRKGESGYNQFSFFSYRWGTTDITSFEVDPEARVEIVTDKEKYVPGEKARILFQTPFSGKMLVTVERNRVFSYRYLDVVNNAASMEIAVEPGFLPNVYVSAVLFRKIQEGDIPLLAGHGFKPIMVEQPSNRLAVSITAPERIRPKTRQKVSVKAGGERNVLVTLAAVDEGVCQVKNYKTPDPYGYFYARKALETETYDFFRDLIPEAKKPSDRSSPGGGEAELGVRVNPIGVQRFKPVAIWSGIVKTGAGGEVEVPLDIPEFQGELRLMAFAYKGAKFGSAQLPMKVSDPVVITPALPRFLAPNDSISMAVTVFNTTQNPVSLSLEVETSGGIVAPVRKVSLDVGANQERAVDVPLRTTSQIGKAVVKVHTMAFGERLESTTELPVRPAAPYGTDALTGFVDGGNSISHTIEDAYLPYARRAYVSVSPYPVANFARELKNLIGYPHGCIEQTVSKAFPQIYLRDIASALAPSITGGGSPTYFVNEAITKIVSMQTFDGNFFTWPGGGAANDWTTVYATHFLLEAKNAGYAVPEGTLKSALNAVAGIARGKKTEDYYSWQAQKVTLRRIADKSCIYALYVLAVAGRPEKSVMNFYRAERSLLTTDTQYLLAGAFALSGERATYHELLPPQFVTEEPQRTSGGNFDSPLRANALVLNVLLETDLNNPAIPRYLEYISKTYRSSSWHSTQDDAFALLALGKSARIASAAKVTGTLTVGGKEYPYKGGSEKFEVEPYGKTVALAIKGEGRAYYAIVVEGIRADGAIRLEDKNLQVRREYLDRNGNPVNIASVRQNDLLVVRITLNSSVDQLQNVAITDLLPAGFELENPRITEATVYPFTKNATNPEYQDIRDDRLNIYTGFRGGKRQQFFYYTVRAVTRGRFQAPAVSAEAMYDANYYSGSGAGTLQVSR